MRQEEETRRGDKRRRQEEETREKDRKSGRKTKGKIQDTENLNVSSRILLITPLRLKLERIVLHFF